MKSSMNEGDRSGRDLDAQYSWEDSYGIALALIEKHPHTPLEEISLGMIYRWTLELPNFMDDPELANDSILSAIYQEWFEEANPL